MPGGASRLEQTLQDSWDRCISRYHLDPHERPRGDRLSNDEVRRCRAAMEELLAVNAPAIDRLRRLAKEAGYSLLLADAAGVVVREYSDSGPARSLKEQGLDEGSIWQESLAGTNGVGTSIFEKRAVTVSGDEHFCHALRCFFCSGAPLTDHDGTLLGAIDLSGPASARAAERPLVHELLEETATAIQAQLFRRHHSDRMLVALSPVPYFALGEPSALIAVDARGRVAGLTPRAGALLGATEPAALIDRSVEQALQVTSHSLESAIGRVQPVGLGRFGNGYALTLAPRASKSLRRAAGRAPPALPIPARPGPSLDRLAGDDPDMAKSVALCRRLIDRDIAILLQGETGTGKDAFAKALHAESARRARPFIAVNCAAMPDSLLDSELFGYAPGTFTGGLAEGKAGKILASHGGTLFLDEIGDMPLALQARLLRVLEEREVTPLGAVEPRPIDVKLISATHRDLARLVEDGRFREDLYYRINGARITLPALRERRDVAAIARATLDELLPEGPGVEIAPEAQALLSAHSWPGNVRQLRNALRFAAYSCTNGRIVPSDLPDDLRSGPPARPAPADLRQVQRQSERDCLLEALQRARWSVSEAARALGISRATAHRKMRDYGIVRPGRS